jgi:hypothetical protein
MEMWNPTRKRGDVMEKFGLEYNGCGSLNEAGGLGTGQSLRLSILV